MQIKHWLCAVIFAVTWNEYELKKVRHWSPATVYSKDGNYETKVDWGMEKETTYTVELTTHTINLATQKDVDLFTGWKAGVIYKFNQNGEMIFSRGISDKAFNVTVKEIK